MVNQGGQYSGGTNNHWIGIIGYRKNNDGTEEIFVSDSGRGRTGWKSITEFEPCKEKIKKVTTIYEE